jgi:hypothetical protein
MGRYWQMQVKIRRGEGKMGVARAVLIRRPARHNGFGLSWGPE